MIAFLTPYWSGADMMRIHLASVRRFHPDAPILISARGGDAGEMEGYRRDFGVEYWLEDCGYTDAYLRLLRRCPARIACVLDHDTVLLASLAPLAADLREGRCDLVGVEERIRVPASLAPEAWPGSNGWLRFAPGCTASNFLMLDWHAFEARFGLRGVLGTPVPGARHFDFDYGIGQRLARHRYLRPFHVERYGLGNLLCDGGEPVLWHQWYGSYRTRLSAAAARPGPEGLVYGAAEAGERAFIADYPALVLDAPSPAWDPECDIEAERRAVLASRPPVSDTARALGQARRRLGHAVRALAARVVVGLEARRPGQSR